MVGYFAGLLVVVSYRLDAIIWQRWTNTIGCFCLAAYGMMIDATPLVVLNFYLVGMNLIQLWRIYTEPVHFKMVSSSISDGYIQDFIERNLDEIKTFFPEFELSDDKNYIVVMIHRNLAQAGLLICHKTDNDTIEVDLDFVLPPYRDMSAGALSSIVMPIFFVTRILPRSLQAGEPPTYRLLAGAWIFISRSQPHGVLCSLKGKNLPKRKKPDSCKNPAFFCILEPLSFLVIKPALNSQGSMSGA